MFCSFKFYELMQVPLPLLSPQGASQEAALTQQCLEEHKPACQPLVQVVGVCVAASTPTQLLYCTCFICPGGCFLLRCLEENRG